MNLSESLESSIDYSQQLCPACPSQGPNDNENWIYCDICRIWFHDSCQNLNPKQVKEIVRFHCISCSKTHGGSEKRRISSRKRHHIDYVALDSGDTQGAILASNSRHAHWNRLSSVNILPHSFTEVKNDIQQYFSPASKLRNPLIIRKQNYSALNMMVPGDLTVNKVSQLVGPDTPLAVMDVKTQQSSPGWDLEMFEKYFNSSIDERETQFNVISLEITGTSLGDEIIRPQIVRDMDLVSKIWPKSALNKKPKVSLYCLMSVQDSYTDFHIDFAGSCVFYHLCRGKKTFLFIEPTKSNLLAYEKWCLMENQNSVFFADMVESCHRVDLDTNDSLIIPSGWIHAVYTPQDAVVIGGNFITLTNMDMQLRLVDIEKRTKVPQKFRFPYFSTVLWYTCLYYLRSDHEPETILEFKGLELIYDHLRRVLGSLDGKESKEVLRISKDWPKEVRKEGEKILEEFRGRLEVFRGKFKSGKLKMEMLEG